MKSVRIAIPLAIGLLAIGGLYGANADDRGGAVAGPGAEQVREVTLKVRKDNGPYREAAYSFRQATQDAAVHKNFVDLLFHRCGQLHVRTVSTSEHRICDLGAAELEKAPDAAAADAEWKTQSLQPVAGHVYLLEVEQDKQSMTVKFRVEEVTDAAVKLAWLTVKPLAGPAPEPGRGRAGTMGQCGGKHGSE
jgi:hypothetical protein